MRRYTKQMICAFLTGMMLMLSVWGWIPSPAPEQAYADAGNNKLQNVFSVALAGTFDYAQAYEVFRQVNQVRAQQGKHALVFDKGLTEAAMQRAAECALFYSHTRPDNTPCNSILDEKYQQKGGENITAGYKTPLAAMNSWVSDSANNANIIEDGYTGIGVGCFTHNGVTYWVQLFSSTGETWDGPFERKQGTAIVHTVEKYASDVKFLNPKTYMRIGEKQNLALEIGNTGWSYYSSVPKFDTVMLTSSDENVATVDVNGVVTVHSAGTARITASFDGVISAECTITVDDILASPEPTNDPAVPPTQTAEPDTVYSVYVEGSYDEEQIGWMQERINEERAACGIEPLTLDQELTEAARQRAAELALYYNNVRPNGSSYLTLLENRENTVQLFAMQYPVAGTVVSVWLEELPEQNPILGADYVSMGAACLTIDGGDPVWILLLGAELTEEHVPEGNFTEKRLVESLGMHLKNLELSVDDVLTPGESTQASVSLINTEWELPFTALLCMDTITFTSSDEAIVQIDENGVVTAGAAGVAYITATLDNGVSAVRKITVEDSAKRMPGDLDNDQAVTASDALAVLKYVVRLQQFDAAQMEAADVTGDGAVRAEDALCILKKVVGLIKTFPVE